MRGLHEHICLPFRGHVLAAALFFSVLCWTGGVAAAQERLLNASDMEFSSTDGGHGYGQASIGADFQSGNFHKAQDAENKTGVFFNADGERQVGIFHLKGNFSFRESFENGVKYASTFDPLRSMPYMIADSTGGNWQKQHYDMWADISAPIVKGWLNGGLGVDIEVGRGAKKVDPRPQTGMCRIELKPSLTVNCTKGFSISAGFIYSLYRETSNLILYDSSVPQKLYLLKGLGQYTYEVFNSTERERKYEGNTLGGALDLRYTGKHATGNMYLEYRNGLEKVSDIDYNKPHHRGNWYTNGWKFGLAFTAPMEGKARVGMAAGTDILINANSGREFVQHFDSSPDINGWVTDSELPGRYTGNDSHENLYLRAYLNSRGNFRRSWVIELNMENNSSIQEYKAASAKETVKNMRFALSAQKFIFTKGGVFDIGVRGKVSRGNGSSLEYTPRESDDENISAGLIDHDFALPSNWYSGNLDMGYSWMLPHDRELRLQTRAFFKDSGRNRLTDEENGLDADSAPGRWWRAGCTVGLAFRF